MYIASEQQALASLKSHLGACTPPPPPRQHTPPPFSLSDIPWIHIPFLDAHHTLGAKIFSMDLYTLDSYQLLCSCINYSIKSGVASFGA